MKKLSTTVVFLLAAALGQSIGAQEVKGNAQAGQTKNALCLGCHGIPEYRATFPELYRVPKISGQNAGYIAAALNAYKKGERKHPTMDGIAAGLSDQDIADLAAYYGGNAGAPTAPATPSRQPSAQVAELLKKVNCASCHGNNFSTPVDPSYPKLAGQHADYLFVALKSYKADKNNTHVGRANPIMGGMVAPLSNNELKALASYIGSLQGDVKTVPESRFR